MWALTQYSHECLHNDVSSNAFFGLYTSQTSYGMGAAQLEITGLGCSLSKN